MEAGHRSRAWKQQGLQAGHESRAWKEGMEARLASRAWMSRDQNMMGLRRFMEGMISKQMLCLQEEYHVLTGEGPPTRKWVAQLVCRLLEVVHGQWVYWNIQVHDEQHGVLRTEEKEHLMQEIEIEMALCFDGFLEMDASFATVTLEDMESSGGGDQEYWLLAARAGRAAKALAEGLVAVDTMPD